jgi:hypothetical protein
MTESFPGHDAGTWAPVPCRVVGSWPAGHFAENLAVDESGAVLISLHSHNRVDRYNAATGSVADFAHLPAPVAGLAFDALGTLWATGGILGRAPGHVWRIEPDGTYEDWVQIPDALFMNGCAPDPDGRTLLACESVTGRVLAIDLSQRRWTSWLDDQRLRPDSDQIPGANGIKLRTITPGSRSPTATSSSASRSGATGPPARLRLPPSASAVTTSRLPRPPRCTSPRTPPTPHCGSPRTARAPRSRAHGRAPLAAPRARSVARRATRARSTCPPTAACGRPTTARSKRPSSCVSRSASADRVASEVRERRTGRSGDHAPCEAKQRGGVRDRPARAYRRRLPAARPPRHRGPARHLHTRQT